MASQTANRQEIPAADYTLTPGQLGSVLETLVEARQPVMVWGPPGVGKSDVSQQVANDLDYEYIDVRALLLDPVDLRGIPWRDELDRTRWAPPAFLPPEESEDEYLINLEELPSATAMVQGAHRSALDWRALLHRFMKSVAARDYTWARPNRRHIDSGLYLPSLHSEAMPPVVFAIDTSGSVDSQMLSTFWDELRDAVAQVNPELVTVVQCDAVVQSVEHYEPTDMPAEIEVLGRGGTAFAPVFAAVEEMERPSCLIYMTDLEYYEEYPSQPAYPVLWAAPAGGQQMNTPPYGEVIEVD